MPVKNAKSATQAAAKKAAQHHRTVDEYQMPAYLQTQLRLFFTLDIVGSTAYKQKNMAGGDVDILPNDAESRKKALHADWFTAIGDFYENTPRLIAQKWDEQSQFYKKIDIAIGEPPTFWKAIGDELGFTKRLNSISQITAGLNSLLNALEKIRQQLKDRDPALDIKASAWVAGFPVTNTEVVFPVTHTSIKEDYQTTHDDAYVFNSLARLRDFYAAKDNTDRRSHHQEARWVRDFTGPSIDTGFRIAANATPRKLIISLELAYMLASDFEKHSGKGSEGSHVLLQVPIMYDGKHSLKGVLGGNPYPIFWLDTEHLGKMRLLHQAENKILGRSDEGNKAEHADVVSFCTEFFKLHEKYVIQPYIITANSSGNSEKIPEYHLKRFKQLKAVVQAFEADTERMKQQNSDIEAPKNLGVNYLPQDTQGLVLN